MTIQTDFEARFPTIPWVEAVASTWSAYTCLEYNDQNKEAILNLIAHLLTLASAPGSGSSRNVASKSVGSVSVSYEASAVQAATGSMAAWFNTTRYGQVYWLLTGRRVGARFV